MGIKVGIHWLSYTTRERLNDVLRVIGEYCCMYGGPNPEQLFQSPGHGGKGYEKVLVGWNGIRVYYTPGRDDIHVEVPGDACEWAGSWRMLRLWNNVNGRLRRLDVAMDGLTDEQGQPISPKFIHAMAWDRPEEICTPANLQGDQSVMFCENRKGQTSYIGAPSSERRVRVYDMRGETRMELQIRGERAAMLGDVLDGKDRDDLPRLVVGLIRGFIDFVEPCSNKSRAKLQRWWAAVVEDIDKVDVVIPRTKPHIDDIWAWLKKQVSTSLEMMTRATGGDLQFLDLLLAEGREKFKARHEHVVTLAEASSWSPK